MNIYLSENIRKLRKEKEITQERLADFLGVTFQSVSKWERGESYPDITMLPSVASFFGISVDELLGVDKAENENKINDYIRFFDKMRLKDTTLTYETLKTAVSQFPGDFRLLVRYMELIMAEKTHDSPDYEKASQELSTIYENIQSYCTDDAIRMWAKRLICQHLHSKSYYTSQEIYQQQAEEILNEMPSMIDSREYLSTMLISDMTKHYEVCGDAIEQLLFLLDNAMSHHCFYDGKFSPEYKIKAIIKINTILETIYTDGNFGKNWLSVIYNYGNLGQLYAECKNYEKAFENLWESAKLAKKYDALHVSTPRTSQFFENRVFEKTLRGKTMCERMNHLFTMTYPLSAEFKESDEFKKLLDFLK